MILENITTFKRKYPTIRAKNVGGLVILNIKIK